jgi:hcp family T6SS protein ctsH3
LWNNFGQRDLVALAAATGDEFAMFSVGGRRLIICGNHASVSVTPEMGYEFARQGWRWSSHTHPGETLHVLRSSSGDRAVLFAMEGRRSVIFNSIGQRIMFNHNGDLYTGWTSW